MALSVEQSETRRIAEMQSGGYFDNTFKKLEQEQLVRAKSQEPGWLGYDTISDQSTIANKSFGGRAVADIGNFGVGLLTLAAKAVTLPFTTSYGLITNPKETIEETAAGAKLLAGGVIKGFKDPLAALGTFGDEEKEAARTYYKAHPGFAALDIFGIASFGAGFAAKSAITSGARAATEAVAKEAIKAGVKRGIIDEVMMTVRGVFNPAKWLGGAERASNILYRGMVKAVRTGDVGFIDEALKNQFIKKGVDETIAAKLSQSAANEVANQFLKQSTRLKVLDSIEHPLGALRRGVTPVAKTTLGTPAEAAVTRVFGINAVKANSRAALEIEQWLDAIVTKEQGLPSTTNNRAVELMKWMERPEYAALSIEEKFSHFRNFIKADIQTGFLRQLTNNDKFVPVKVISTDVAQTMKSNIVDNIEVIKSEIQQVAEEGNVVDKTWSEIRKILEETSGRDFKNNEYLLREAFGETGDLVKLYSAIDSLTQKRSSVNFSEWSEKAQKIASELEGTGYRIGLAPEGKQVSLVSEVVGEKSTIPVTKKTFSGLLKHIKEKGGITVDFNGNIINSGFSFSILDKVDEIRIKTSDTLFKQNFIDNFNKLKEKYGSQEGAHLGGWLDGDDFVIDIVKVGDNMIQSIYEGILKKQDAVGDLGRYFKGEDGTIFITKEIVDSLDPISGRSLREAGSSFRDWGEIVSYYTEKNFKNSFSIGEINGKYVDKIGLKFTESTLDSHRTFVGRVLDRFGVSFDATPEGSISFYYRDGFNQHVLNELQPKFGNTLTIKNAFGSGRNIKIPITELFDFLKKNIERVNRIRYNEAKESLFKFKEPLTEATVLTRVFDYSKGILKERVGFSDEVATAIDKIARQSLQDIPTSVTGLGDKLVNYLRGGSSDLLLYGRHFDKYIKVATYARYRSPIAFLFQLQQGFETSVQGSMLVGGKYLPGAGTLVKLSNYIPDEKFAGILGKVKKNIQRIIITPDAKDVSIIEQYVVPDVHRSLDDVSSSIESSHIQQQLSSSKGEINGRKLSNIYKKNIEGWAVDKVTKVSAAFAEKFGMTLKDAFTQNADGTFKNPRIVREIKELSQQLLFYKQGFLTSPAARTLNLVFFPFRFQAKTLDITAKWIGNMSPAARIATIESMIYFANWAGTEEGIEWRRTHKNLLYSFASYATAYEQIGEGLNAVSRGKVFGGNAGLIGGVPFAWMVEFARDLAVIPEDTETYDPRTGRPFELRETPREFWSTATGVKLIEEYFTQLMPGMPFYTLSGGYIQGASPKHWFKNLVEGAYSGLLTWQYDYPKEAADALLREQFLKVPMDETVPLFSR